MYLTDIGPFYEKVILLSGADTQSSSKHGRHSFYCKRRQEHTVSHSAKPYSPVFLRVTVFLRDTFKCQAFFFFSFEIVTVNECVESVLYIVSLGCLFCPLIDLRCIYFWLVGSSVHTMCSCPFRWSSGCLNLAEVYFLPSFLPSPLCAKWRSSWLFS